MLPILNFFFAALLWVQVPQWSDDWSNCAVDVPDTSCHWYIVQADNTFGEGFDWETAPWYSMRVCKMLQTYMMMFLQKDISTQLNHFKNEPHLTRN